MLECLTEWMMPPLYVWLGAGVVPARVGVRHNMIVPYGAYPCADGEVIFAVQNDSEWRRFCAQVLAMPAEVRERALRAVPTGRLIEPAEIAAAVAFLAGAEAAQISGQTLAVDGALSLPQLSLGSERR